MRRTDLGSPKAKGATEGCSTNARVALLREKIRQIYEACNPAKISEMDALFSKYAGVGEEWYRRICVKYGATLGPLPAEVPAPTADKDINKRESAKETETALPAPTFDDKTAVLYRRYRAMLDGA